MFCMKKFEGLILSTIIITLIVSSAQTATAADLDEDVSWHEDRRFYAVDTDLNLRYEVYLQSVVRDAQGQLLSVSESTIGWTIISSFPDGVQIPGLVDLLIDNNVIDEKRVVTIDNVKYEKIQFQTERIVDHDWLTPIGTGNMSTGTMWKFCGDFSGKYGYQCVPVFGAKTPQIHLAIDNLLTNQWTILRVIN